MQDADGLFLDIGGLGNHRPSYCASFIEADLADVVAPFDNDDKDAAFADEVTGDLDEEPTVVLVVGVEARRCEVRRTVVIAVEHLFAVLLVIAIMVILILSIAVILVIAIVVVLAVAVVAIVMIAIVVVPVFAIVIILVRPIAVILSLLLVIVLVLMVVVPLIIVPEVLVLAIPLAVLPIIVVMIFTVVLVLAIITVVGVFIGAIAVVVARVFVTTTIMVVVTAGPSARGLAISIAVVRSRAIVLSILAFGDTDENSLGTGHEGDVKAFALPDLGIMEWNVSFSWDEARREVKSGVGVVAFGKEVPVFGRAGVEFDEFREESRDLVRGQRGLD